MYIVVPADFSPLAYNAANFAAAMLRGQYDATLLLYHVYEDPQEKDAAEAALKVMKDKLIDENILRIECVAEQNENLVDALDKKLRQLDAVLLVMGISGKTKMEQVFSSSNSLRMIEKNICPVMVIPPDASYNQMKNVALASDFKDVESSIPLAPVKRILNIFRPNLHIVNINSEIYVSLTQEILEERAKLKSMFAEFSPEFYFITTYDFHETLQQFIADKNIDLVLTFPRKHSFIEHIFKTSNTRKLVYESSVPVLAAHE